MLQTCVLQSNRLKTTLSRAPAAHNTKEKIRLLQRVSYPIWGFCHWEVLFVTFSLFNSPLLSQAQAHCYKFSIQNVQAWDQSRFFPHILPTLTPICPLVTILLHFHVTSFLSCLIPFFICTFLPFISFHSNFFEFSVPPPSTVFFISNYQMMAFVFFFSFFLALCPRIKKKIDCHCSSAAADEYTWEQGLMSNSRMIPEPLSPLRLTPLLRAPHLERPWKYCVCVRH